MVAPIKTVVVVTRQIDAPFPGIKRYVFEDQDNWPLPPFKPGAHIDVHLGTGLVRTYSLCNDPSNNRQYVIAVKREVNGRGGSKYIHDNLKIGDRIGVSLPRGGIQADDIAMNIFVAGGIGITPFISAIHDLEMRGKSNYVLHWSSMGPPPPSSTCSRMRCPKVGCIYTTHWSSLGPTWTRSWPRVTMTFELTAVVLRPCSKNSNRQLPAGQRTANMWSDSPRRSWSTVQMPCPLRWCSPRATKRQWCNPTLACSRPWRQCMPTFQCLAVEESAVHAVHDGWKGHPSIATGF